MYGQKLELNVLYWLIDILSSSSFRLWSNRSASDSRTDGNGRCMTASSDWLRLHLSDRSHWSFLLDCSMNSAFWRWWVCNEWRRRVTWIGKAERQWVSTMNNSVSSISSMFAFSPPLLVPVSFFSEIAPRFRFLWCPSTRTKILNQFKNTQ